MDATFSHNFWHFSMFDVECLFTNSYLVKNSYFGIFISSIKKYQNFWASPLFMINLGIKVFALYLLNHWFFCCYQLNNKKCSSAQHLSKNNKKCVTYYIIRDVRDRKGLNWYIYIYILKTTSILKSSIDKKSLRTMLLTIGTFFSRELWLRIRENQFSKYLRMI